MEEYRIIGPEEAYSLRADPLQQITVAHSDVALDNTPMAEPLRTEVTGMPEWTNTAERQGGGGADQLPEERRDTNNDGPLDWKRMSMSASSQTPLRERRGEEIGASEERSGQLYSRSTYRTRGILE
jgi:hypothetical protein